jgi:hypothetical protein
LLGGGALAAVPDVVQAGPCNVTPFDLYYEGHKPGVDDAATRAQGQNPASGSLRLDPMKASLTKEMEKHAKRHADNPALGSFG